MPINKTKAGTYTFTSGNGHTVENAIVWNAMVNSTGRRISNLNTSGTPNACLWVKVKLNGGTTYHFKMWGNYDTYIWLYNSNASSELNSNDDSDFDVDGEHNHGSYITHTPSSTDNFLVKLGGYSNNTGTCNLDIYPVPLELDVRKIYDTSPNFDKQGYMVDFFSLEEAEIKAPIVAQGGLDFDLSFQNGLIESLTGITGMIEDNTYFEMANDGVVGNYLLCKKIKGSQRKVVFSGTENMFQYGTGNFTVSFWLKAPNFVGFGQSILGKHDGSTGFSVYNTTDNASDTAMEMRVSQSNSNVDLSTSAVNESNWTHWLFMRENNTGYWYKNGTKISQVAMGERNVNNNSPLTIGFTNCAPYWGANFGITSLKIYGKSMRDFEITGLSREFRI